MRAIKQASCLLVICFVTLASGGCFLIPIPISGDDADEARAVALALTKRYDFPAKSQLQPMLPAVGARATPYVSEISVVGVLDPVEQDRVVAILRDIRSTIAKKPIHVRFYREELVTRWSNPETRTSGARSELIDLLRTVRIK